MIALRNVLVATDFGTCSERALTYGRDLARTFNATLHVIHVLDDMFARYLGTVGPLVDPSRLQHKLEAEARKTLGELMAHGGRSLRTVAVMRTASTPAEEIVSYAKEADVDLVVVGTHGRGAMAHMLLGSVAEKVARTAPCPVLTVRTPDEEIVEPDALLVRAWA